MKSLANIYPNVNEAASSLAAFSTLATPMPASSLWKLLKPRAVKASPEKLEFADGSALLFAATAAAPVALAA